MLRKWNCQDCFSTGGDRKKKNMMRGNNGEEEKERLRENVCCFKPPACGDLLQPPPPRGSPVVRGRGLRSERLGPGQGIVSGSDCSHTLVAKLQQRPCGLRSLKYSLPGPL